MMVVSTSLSPYSYVEMLKLMETTGKGFVAILSFFLQRQPGNLSCLTPLIYGSNTEVAL